MWLIRIFFIDGDIEVFPFDLIKGIPKGDLCIFDSSLDRKQFAWADIYKTEVFKSEVI